MRRARIALVLLVVAVGAPFLSPRLRTQTLVRWHAWGLDSPDMAVRARSIEALAALGFPAIDEVYPKLATVAIRDAYWLDGLSSAARAPLVLFVGPCAAPIEPPDNNGKHEREVIVERWLKGGGVSRAIVDEVPSAFSRVAWTGRWLVLARTRYLSMMLPLPDETPEVLEVARELAR
jgi:hypothetical protein